MGAIIGSFLIMGITILTIGAVIGITPFFSKKNVYFGVTFSQDMRDFSEFKRLRKKYIVSVALLTVVSLVSLGFGFFFDKTEAQLVRFLGIGGTVAIFGLLLVSMLIYFKCHREMKSLRESLGGAFQSESYSHDDAHWYGGGFFYYNPDDPAIFLEKKVGIGWTVNFARWQARALIIAILALAILPVLPLLFV